MGKTIHPIDGEEFRYFADSDGPHADTYLIDLTEYDGHGKCACMDFATQHEPKLVRGQVPTTEDDLMCKHLRRAHIFNSRERIFGA